MKTLVFMAAGVGSRYGGLKQLDAIDSEGHSIIDYSIYDALEAGFDHIVFIIRKELHREFISRYAHLTAESVSISYVFQEIDDVPSGFDVSNRQKPWGTGQALLSLRHLIQGSFALINADDFYGKLAFKTMYQALFEKQAKNSLFMIGYPIENTLSPHGSVSRGVCTLDNHSNLIKIIERTAILKAHNRISYTTSTGNSGTLSKNTVVSMNFWGFSPTIFQDTEVLFEDFLKRNYHHPKKEFYIPSVINQLVQTERVIVKVLPTSGVWHGITYKEDKQHVIKAIENMARDGLYPSALWKTESIRTIFNQFKHSETYKNAIELTSGLINSTYKIETESDAEYILQCINSTIFPNPKKLIANKVSVSQHLQHHSNYVVSQYLHIADNNYLFSDRKGHYWSLSTLIKNSKTYATLSTIDMAKQAGMLLGDFHQSLSSFDAATLFETLPNFHNLSDRIQAYNDALKHADTSIIKSATTEIQQIESLGKHAKTLDALKRGGKIPQRAVHNDAKLSNMLFDNQTHKAVAMIDLDTVMSGIIHYDIGDTLRSIGTKTKEDEADISKISFNLEVYKAFMESYLLTANTMLSEIEKTTIPLSIAYIVFEQALRFLTDYLKGNVYYKVNYPEHNLVRTKNQLQLLQIVHENFEALEAIHSDLLAAISKD